jgi:hypothetical protein
MGRKILSTTFASLVLASYPLATWASLSGARSGLKSAGSAVYGDEADGTTQLPAIIGSIINAALGLLGVVLVVLLIYGGFLWMTAGGNSDQVDKAKKMIINSVIGIIIVLAAYSISYYVLEQVMMVTGVGADGSD